MRRTTSALGFCLLWIASSSWAGTITSVNPDHAHPGESLTVAITGQGTVFMQGTSVTNQVWFAQGSSTINATHVSVHSAASLDADFSIPTWAPIGMWSASVLQVGGAGIVTRANGLRIVGGGSPDWLAGMDANGDDDCEAVDLDRGRFYPASEIGTTDSFRIFFRGPDPILSTGCVFCVTVDSLLGTVSFAYAPPAGWTTIPIMGEESQAFTVSPAFDAAYPNHHCWLVQETDFSGAHPVWAYPLLVGTFRYQIANEGGIHFAFDAGEGGQGVAVLTTGFSSVIFTEDQTCNYAILEPCLTPSLLLPTNGSPGVDTAGTLDWSDVPGALSYEVQIGASCGSGETYSVGSSEFHYDGLDHGRTYYWRVVAHCAGSSSGFTDCWSFTTATEGRFEATSDTALVGKDFLVVVQGRNECEIKGYSVLVRFDPAVFAVDDAIVDTVGTVAAGARILTSAATDTTAKVGVVFSYGCPPSIATGEHAYVKFRLHVRPSAPLGPTSVEILDIPPTLNRMTHCNGTTLVPERAGGTITIVREAFVRGDADGDGEITISDPIANLAYQFTSAPLGCLDAADDDDNGEVNISDPIYSLAYQFEGGTEPPRPFPWCDADPTGDALACACDPACMACTLGTFQGRQGAGTVATLMVNGVRRIEKDRITYTLYLKNDAPLWGLEYTFRYPSEDLRFERIAGNDFEFSSGRADKNGGLVRVGNVVSMSLARALPPGIHGVGQLEFTVLQKASEDPVLEFMSGLCTVAGGESGTVVYGAISAVPSADPAVPRSIDSRIVPNPFNPATTVHYAVPHAGPVRIEIYNMLGQRVRSLVDETEAAGFYAVPWDGSDDSGAPLGSGVFFCRIRVNDASETRKLLLVR